MRATVSFVVRERPYEMRGLQEETKYKIAAYLVHRGIRPLAEFLELKRGERDRIWTSQERAHLDIVTHGDPAPIEGLVYKE